MNLRRHSQNREIPKTRSPRRMTREEQVKQHQIEREVNYRRSLATREGLIAAGLVKPASK